MKKTIEIMLAFFVLLVAFLIVSNFINKDETITYELDITNAKVVYEVNEEFDNENMFIKASDDTVINITYDMISGFDTSEVRTVNVTITYLEYISEIYSITVIENEAKVILDNLELPNTITNHIELPTSIDGYNITWSSSNEAAITSKGIVSFNENEYRDIIVLKASINGFEKEFNIQIEMPEIISYEITNTTYNENILKIEIIGKDKNDVQYNFDFTNMENFNFIIEFESSFEVSFISSFENGYCYILDDFTLLNITTKLNNEVNYYVVDSINQTLNEVTELNVYFIDNTLDLQTVIYNSNENDTLCLKDGVYEFTKLIFVNKKLNIIGSSMDNTILKFTGSGYGQASIIFEREGSLCNLTLDCLAITESTFTVKISPFEGTAGEAGLEITSFLIKNVVSKGGKGLACHFVDNFIIDNLTVLQQTVGGVCLSVASSFVTISNSTTISTDKTWGSIGVMYSENNYAYPKAAYVVVENNNNFDHVLYSSRYDLFGDTIFNIKDPSYVSVVSNNTQVFSKEN